MPCNAMMCKVPTCRSHIVPWTVIPVSHLLPPWTCPQPATWMALAIWTLASMVQAQAWTPVHRLGFLRSHQVIVNSVSTWSRNAQMWVGVDLSVAEWIHQRGKATLGVNGTSHRPVPWGEQGWGRGRSFVSVSLEERVTIALAWICRLSAQTHWLPAGPQSEFRVYRLWLDHWGLQCADGLFAFRCIIYIWIISCLLVMCSNIYA